VSESQLIGRFLVATGIAIVLLGVVLLLWPGQSGLGRLPGDVRIERGPLAVYAPLTSCLLVSILLTLVLNLVLWVMRR
jgi:hypothetical protein